MKGTCSLRRATLPRGRGLRPWPRSIFGRVALAGVLGTVASTAAVVTWLSHSHHTIKLNERAAITRELEGIPGLFLIGNTWQLRIGPYLGGNGNETACGISVSVQVRAPTLTPALIDRIHSLPPRFDIQSTMMSGVYLIKTSHPIHETFDWIDMACVGEDFVDS